MKYLINLTICLTTFSCTLQRPPEAVTIRTPVSVPTELNMKDSSILCIYINEKDYKLTFLNDTIITNDSSKIGKFIDSKIVKIKSTEIILYRNTNASDNKFRWINNLLQMRNNLRFKLATQ